MKFTLLIAFHLIQIVLMNTDYCKFNVGNNVKHHLCEEIKKESRIKSKCIGFDTREEIEFIIHAMDDGVKKSIVDFHNTVRNKVANGEPAFDGQKASDFKAASMMEMQWNDLLQLSAEGSFRSKCQTPKDSESDRQRDLSDEGGYPHKFHELIIEGNKNLQIYSWKEFFKHLETLYKVPEKNFGSGKWDRIFMKDIDKTTGIQQLIRDFNYLIGCVLGQYTLGRGDTRFYYICHYGMIRYPFRDEGNQKLPYKFNHTNDQDLGNVFISGKPCSQCYVGSKCSEVNKFLCAPVKLWIPDEEFYPIYYTINEKIEDPSIEFLKYCDRKHTGDIYLTTDTMHYFCIWKYNKLLREPNCRIRKPDCRVPSEEDIKDILDFFNGYRDKLASGDLKVGHGVVDQFPKASDMVKLEWDNLFELAAQIRLETCEYTSSAALDIEKRITGFNDGTIFGLDIITTEDDIYMTYKRWANRVLKRIVDDEMKEMNRNSNFDTNFVYNPRYKTAVAMSMATTYLIGCSSIVHHNYDDTRQAKIIYHCVLGRKDKKWPNGSIYNLNGEPASKCPQGTTKDQNEKYKNLCVVDSSKTDFWRSSLLDYPVWVDEVERKVADSTEPSSKDAYCEKDEQHVLCSTYNAITNKKGIKISSQECEESLKFINDLRMKVAKESNIANMNQIEWSDVLDVLIKRYIVMKKEIPSYDSLFPKRISLLSGALHAIELENDWEDEKKEVNEKLKSALKIYFGFKFERIKINKNFKMDNGRGSWVDPAMEVKLIVAPDLKIAAAAEALGNGNIYYRFLAGPVEVKGNRNIKLNIKWGVPCSSCPDDYECSKEFVGLCKEKTATGHENPVDYSDFVKEELGRTTRKIAKRKIDIIDYKKPCHKYVYSDPGIMDLLPKVVQHFRRGGTTPPSNYTSQLFSNNFIVGSILTITLLYLSVVW